MRSHRFSSYFPVPARFLRPGVTPAPFRSCRPASNEPCSTASCLLRDAAIPVGAAEGYFVPFDTSRLLGLASSFLSRLAVAGLVVGGGLSLLTVAPAQARARENLAVPTPFEVGESPVRQLSRGAGRRRRARHARRLDLLSRGAAGRPEESRTSRAGLRLLDRQRQHAGRLRSGRTAHRPRTQQRPRPSGARRARHQAAQMGGGARRSRQGRRGRPARPDGDAADRLDLCRLRRQPEGHADRRQIARRFVQVVPRLSRRADLRRRAQQGRGPQAVHGPLRVREDDLAARRRLCALHGVERRPRGGEARL